MRTAPALAAAAAGLALVAGAQAEIVEVSFEGTVDSTFGDILPTVGTGATFTGFFRYDTSVPPLPGEGGVTPGPGDTINSYHSMLEYSITFEENNSGGPLSFVTFHANQFGGDRFFETVTNDQPDFFEPGVLIDTYANRVGQEITDTGGTVIETLTWGITLNSRDGGPFTSSALPESLSLSDFDTGLFSFDKEGDFGLPIGSISGNLTSVTSTIVPAPGAGALLAAGMLGACRRRRRA